MRTIPKSLIKDKTYCVNYLIYKDESNNTAYLYIAIRNDQVSEFQSAIKRGNFDAEDYGIILEQGEGEAPEVIKQKMSMMYNCNHDSSISILDYNPEEKAET